jgi:hypothetical protein
VTTTLGKDVLLFGHMSAREDLSGLPLGRLIAPETARRRTLRVGARLERVSLTTEPPPSRELAESMTLCVDGGHVKSIRNYHVRSFETLVAHAKNDKGRDRLFSTLSVVADGERTQLGTVLRELGATAATAVTVVSDGADAPRTLGEKASPGPTRHPCAFSTPLRRPRAGHATAKPIGATAPRSPNASSTSVGGCGTAKRSEPSI